jgi:hypothetical protein
MLSNKSKMNWARFDVLDDAGRFLRTEEIFLPRNYAFEYLLCYLTDRYGANYQITAKKV